MTGETSVEPLPGPRPPPLIVGASPCPPCGSKRFCWPPALAAARQSGCEGLSAGQDLVHQPFSRRDRCARRFDKAFTQDALALVGTAGVPKSTEQNG